MGRQLVLSPHVDHAPLIARILEGDSRAYGELVRRYQRMVYTVCHRVLRNAQDADEAAQDSFVKAYQHLRGFSGSSKFSTWLYSIAYRTAVSHSRRRRSDGASVDELGQHPMADAVQPGQADDVRQKLDRALAELPPEDAALLSFYYLEELSVEEIVTVTGLGASNVKVKLHRGRKKLAEALEQQLGPEARMLLLNDA
jgi:RNA polymerase sigma-70 factor (ECF subfamily)